MSEGETGGGTPLRTLAAQFAKFGVVGVTNTAISYALYAGLVFAEFHWLPASVTSFVVSVLWGFYWNNRMVFRLEEGATRSIPRALAKTFVSYGLTGLVLANILLYLQIDVLGVNEYLAPLVNLLVTVPLNFLLNRNWAFKAK